MGRVLLGLGLCSCQADPVGGVDAGVDAGTELDGGVVFPELASEARLLQVDARQTFLVSAREDGTYAQPLPTGAAVRIAGPVEAAVAANDGSAALLRSAPVDGVRSLWWWRPGGSDAISLTTRARGDEVHDAALSYVAFLEAGAGDVTSLRMARKDACTPEGCALTTVVELQGGAPELRAAGGTLFLVDGTKAWFVDVATGAVTSLGALPGRPFISPEGTRYGWAVEDQVLLFDAATGSPVWDHVWRNDEARPGWLPLDTPIMLDEVHVLVNTEGRWKGAPQEVPLGHSLFACDGQGCREAVSSNMCWTVRLAEEQRALYCREDLCPFVRCSLVNTLRDSAAGLLSISGESGTLLGPAFSEGFTAKARLRAATAPDAVPSLEWEQGGVTTKRAVQGAVPQAPFLFVPGPRRVLYLQEVTEPDGVQRHHLWTWDLQQAVDLGALEGFPLHQGAVLVRDNPPALYLDTVRPGADGRLGTAVVRVPL
ncbi:hypothetical protein [Corallococcus sp. Z5C101001]|uniref:hypothetical protein n=1 Tax=Corallococcus sp. Z5C101001 TaxID=2596829 RepID=UPI001181247C|nr:hypothetical protein [Corallococcus sp. Z5C101001]TSC32330.1 hypothetical protein FOF48_09810 [Corallococcus sp. Z5C101001]